MLQGSGDTEPRIKTIQERNCGKGGETGGGRGVEVIEEGKGEGLV